jgi:hypothetical protein
MTPDIQTPVVVADGLDVTVYPTLEEAVANLEGVDVARGVYRVFDSVGRRVTLGTHGVRQVWFMVDIGTVHVMEIESQPTGGSDLRELLLSHLRARHLQVDESWDLAALVKAAT